MTTAHWLAHLFAAVATLGPFSLVLMGGPSRTEQLIGQGLGFVVALTATQWASRLPSSASPVKP